MGLYKIRWKSSAAKELRKIPKNDIAAVLEKVEALALDPRMPGIKKLVGSKISYRARVGNYRVIYEIHDDVLYIDIIKIKHRKDVYR